MRQEERTKGERVPFASSPISVALITDFAKHRMPCPSQIQLEIRCFHEAIVSLSVCRRV